MTVTPGNYTLQVQAQGSFHLKPALLFVQVVANTESLNLIDYPVNNFELLNKCRKLYMRAYSNGLEFDIEQTDPGQYYDVKFP